MLSNNSELHLIIDKNYSAYVNMAIDEYLFRRAVNDKKIIFRLYGWDKPSITIGYFQVPERYFDLDKIKNTNIPFVRRMTGGRGVYHFNELTYSFSMEKSLFSPFKKREIFQFITKIFYNAFEKLNIKSKIQLESTDKFNKTGNCFNSVSEYELTDSNYNKLIGSAQYITETGVLQQGSIPLSEDIYNIDDYLLERKKSNGKKVKTILMNYKKSEIIDAIKKVCENMFDVVKLNDIKIEEKGIEHLVKDKYIKKEWNFKRFL